MVYYGIQIKRATKLKAPGGNILQIFLLRYIYCLHYLACYNLYNLNVK